VQLLSRPPGAPITVLPQVFDDQAHIVKRLDTRLRMPKPKAFRKTPHQAGSLFHQLRRCRNPCRRLVEFIRSVGHRSKRMRLDTGRQAPVVSL
jgi:hypothetical protein